MRTEKTSAVVQGFRKRRRRYYIVSSILVLMVVLLAVIMMIYGNTVYMPCTVLRVIFGEDVQGATFTIRTLRLPRMMIGVLSGIAFGMSGNTFQKLLGNPLASPDIIGITSGASAAAVFSILILGLNGNIVSLLSVLAGILTASLIYTLSLGGGFSNGRLILIGIGIQSFLNAAISWMLLKASEYDVASALRWLSGSLNGVSMDNVPGLTLAVCVSGIALFLFNRHLDILQLGEAYASTLGVRIKVVRLLLILFALLLTAFGAAVTGPISSVAFLSGPIASKLTGERKGNLFASGMTGAVLVLAGDLVGQYAFPARYPTGVITGILGAPYLLFLLLRMNRKGE